MEDDLKFRSFIENCDIGIVTFNKNLEFLDINSKFCGMIGYDRNELVNYNFPEPFWPQPLFSKEKNDFDVFKITGLLNIETFFCRKDKSYIPVDISGSFILNEEEQNTEYILLIQDISERKKQEREFKLSQDMLIELNNRLEKLVQQRTNMIKEVMKQKNEFINQLGHDLKNPINPLVNLLPVLHEKVSDGESQEIINVIDRNIKYMRDLVVKTIELAKLDMPNIQLNFEPIRLKQEIDEIIKNNFIFNNEMNIQINNNIADDIVIEMDQLRLKELIINIIGNSLKYGKENGYISITSQYDDTNHLLLRISDDGQGMNPDQLQKVFNEFYKVNYNTSTYNSSGLGMSICKRIVEKHGGTITCESPGIGKGTTVICILPVTHHEFEDKIINQQLDWELKTISKSAH